MAKHDLKIELARAYHAPASHGSYRVLVDRLWPRGVKKEDLKIDAWEKELAPTTELRRWFNHDPDRWEEFRKRYFKELDANVEQVAEMLKAAGNKPLLLLYGAHDEEHNQAVALKQWIEKHAAKLKSQTKE